MGNFNQWNIRLLQQQRDKIVEEMAKNPSPEALEELYTLYYLLDNDFEAYGTPSGFTDKINEDKEISLLRKTFKSAVCQFASYQPIMPDARTIELVDYNMPNSFLFSFIHDFYNSIPDQEISKLFNRVFREKSNNLRFIKGRSHNIYLPYSRYSYIEVGRNNTIEDIDQIVHEYGHSVADLICYHSNNTPYPFVELPSIFFYLIAMDVFDENYEMENETNKYRTANTKMFIDEAKEIQIFEKYFKLRNSYKSQRGTIKDLMKQFKISKPEAKLILTEGNQERYNYVIGFLGALELYYLYKIDKEKALYILKEIIKMSDDEENYNEELEKLEIHLNEHTRDFISRVKKIED